METKENKHIEVAHINRNFIEASLYRLKFFLKENKKIIKKIFLIIFLFAILLSAWFTIYFSASKKHNKDFFQVFVKYEKVRKEIDKKLNKSTSTPLVGNQSAKILDDKKLEESDKKELSQIIQELKPICEQILATKYSNHACLLMGEVYLELGEFKQTADFLSKYGYSFKNKMAGPYVLFFAAQAYENVYDFNKAYEIYSLLENILRGKKDLALFHKAKILYYQKKLTQAKSEFESILKNYANTKYKKEVKEYLLLVDISLK